MRFVILVLAVLLILVCLVLWPRIDLIVSGFFYAPGEGFFLGHALTFRMLHYVAFAGARLLGLLLLFMILLTWIARTPVAGIDAKGWLFLFVGLLLGPALIANVVLKDHWGRARPREVVEFGGAAKFSPPLLMSHACRRNCSFVAGDAAFGFYLPAFAYVAPERRSRRVFWGLTGIGGLFGLARLAAGAHFFSDVIYAAFFMLAALALLHLAMFGAARTRSYWRHWLFLPAPPPQKP